MTNIADLVAQETTTTGTGAYTVSGVAPTYRRTWAAAFTVDTVDVPYGVIDSAGNFEFGLGAWSVGTLSLARTLIMASSNAGAAVNWGVGTKKIICTSSVVLSRLAAVKHNLVAIIPPTITDDNTKGYNPGSLWYNAGADDQVGVLYICVSGATGGARWSMLTSYASLSTPGGRMGIAAQIHDTRAYSYYGNSGFSFSGGNIVGTPHTFADGAVFAAMAKTADATPRKMAFNDNYAGFGSIPCGTPSAMTLTGTVSAINSANGDCKTWKIEAVVKTTAGGVTSVALGAAPTSLYNDAGMASASIAMVGGTNECAVQVTGIAATNIVWSASLQLSTATYF